MISLVSCGRLSDGCLPTLSFVILPWFSTIPCDVADNTTIVSFWTSLGPVLPPFLAARLDEHRHVLLNVLVVRLALNFLLHKTSYEFIIVLNFGCVASQTFLGLSKSFGRLFKSFDTIERSDCGSAHQADLPYTRHDLCELPCHPLRSREGFQ